ncbi:MAG: ABC transporter ATP-binding protein [Nocardioides sp.]|nr:ABC transporter ATP-binding protein [Nocardioides sp.]
MQSEPPFLAASDLTKTFGESAALRGVSFGAERGEIIAVTGPSGSGKSTLLLCLSGILLPTGGDVVFDGKALRTMNEAARSRLRRTEFGVLFQFGQLVPELTAVENVALPLLLSGNSRREATTTAGAWMDRLGVGELVARRPTQMSGGQAQRVALARSLVTGPKILFADEPTGALDRQSGEMVLTHMVDAAKSSGTSVVLVTHDRHVASFADREVVIEDGLATAHAH